MNKLLSVLVFSCLPFIVTAQAEEAKLLGQWHNDTLVPTVWFDNVYNDVWGLSLNSKEYAIIGSTAGTHFIEVTDPTSPTEVAFVEGAVTGQNIIHRDFHDHQGFLYAVADEGAQSTLQIIDFSTLPDSVRVIYDSKEYIRRSHNIFIDTSRSVMYACFTGGDDSPTVPLRLFDISDPGVPVPISTYYSIEGFNMSQVHDAYASQGIAYLNCGPSGLAVADFNDPLNPILLGSLSTNDYPQAGYNHSGWLSEDGYTYFMADETHGMDLKVFDVSSLPEITLLDTIDAEALSPTSIAHNLIVRNDYLYVSYYYDGLQIFDISDVNNIQRAFYYDTYLEADDNSYHGAWGVYPFLPSGNILVSDMQSGLFVFESIEPISSSSDDIELLDCQIYPNPTTGRFSIRVENPSADLHYQVFNPMGKKIATGKIVGLETTVSLFQDLPAGAYTIIIMDAQSVRTHQNIILSR